MYELTEEDYKIAESNGISRNTARHRYQYYFWDKDRAITEPVRGYIDKSKWVKIAEKNGVSRATFHYRMWKYKWSEEKAATTPTATKKQGIEKLRQSNRRYPEWVYEEMKKNNVPQQTFLNRMNMPNTKWTMEEACAAPKGTRLADWRLRHYQSS